MRIKNYYLIKPSACLMDALSGSSSKLAPILLESELWSQEEGGITVWRAEDCLARVKLLYLAYLEMEYGCSSEFKEIFGESIISLAEFDKWWTIERYGLEDNIEWVQNELNTEMVRRIIPTGMPVVDEWIASLREKNGL
jgi:hypothetical protein